MTRRRIWWEVAIVLGLSLGASAVYAIVALIADLSSGKSLADQSAALNTSQSATPWLDVTYQLLGVFFDLFPVALAIYLLWMPGRSAFEAIGLTWRRPGRDLGTGLLLAAAIGIPGLAFYALGRLAGITVSVQASPLDPHWWTIPLLVLSAVRAALQEEIIVVGYLFARLRELEWGKWATIIASAVLRGSYHLYQGVGPFFGNAVMGVVFGWVYSRWGRTAPLVVAHAVLDIVSFVGYPVAVAAFPAIFR
ncbi:MAG: CPBP family intramembrane metalloprotease [Microbacteriaceae bacterium]|nr:CPBP family intramembrane metalloprotease [Microbacteriaceae bacterium]